MTRGSGMANSQMISWSSAGSSGNFGKVVARLIFTRRGCVRSFVGCVVMAFAWGDLPW